eukprot:c20484_g1_i1 orf=137-1627(-)
MADSRVCEGGEAVMVSVVSRETVLPAKPTERHNYFLSCFDIFWKVNHYNQRLIFYESAEGSESGQEGSATDGRAAMEKLKSSLALCLVHYYPWCGRLAIDGEPDHRLVIDCNDAGVEFVEAYIDLPISLLSQQGFQMKPFFEKLCQHVDHSGDCLYSSPLLSIQATLFSDGGLALGITQSHVVADGQALWNFMVSWGECSRGIPLSSPPLLNRELLALPNPSPEKATWRFNPKLKEEDIEDSDAKQNEDALMHKDEVSAGTHSSENGKVSGEASQPAPLVQCVLNLPSSAIKKLKSEDGGVHTSYEVTCAHLWQRITAARHRPSCELTSIYVLANCRSRLKPPLPPTYFGNAIGFSLAVSTVGKICSETLHATSSRVHDTVVEIVQDSLVGYMHWLEIPGNDLMAEVIPNLPKGKGINMASSPRFPVYEVDFGWGKPAAVRSPKVPGEGELVFFGGNPRSAPGDVEICVALLADDLRHLLEDPKFLAKTPCSPFAT